MEFLERVFPLEAPRDEDGTRPSSWTHGSLSLLEQPVIRLADAYYASRMTILPLVALGHHLVTRVRTSCVAHEPAATPIKRKRGRPRKYGRKVRLHDLWDHAGFVSAPSPVYGEADVTIR